MRLAVQAVGFYPQGKNVVNSFLVQKHQTDEDKRLIYVWVVFEDKHSADKFITSVDLCITTTGGVTIVGGFDRSTTASFEATATRVLSSHYIACQENGEAPMDSPVWDVEFSSIGMSSKATSYATEDTVFKYQRVETEAAFERGKAEGAHIFPKAM